ncbi:MAG TPA: hypothetical protein DEQ34_13225, partial [Balneolaceae bacterium]|nr:hypothetical protein [Balneolaceae bacterium]
MFGSFDSEKLAGWLGKWWFSLLLIIPVILMTEFAWTGLSVNVMLTLNYPFVFPFSFIYFLTDNLNLIIHESGHTIFGIFGWRFLTVLGGTLMQLLIPFSVFLYAHINRSKITAQISLFWLGMNWIDSAIYCADAYYQNLPLIGNLPKSSHDYLNLLSSLNILD